MLDELAEVISKLALELSQMKPDSPEYAAKGEALADWLMIFSDMGLDSEDALG